MKTRGISDHWKRPRGRHPWTGAKLKTITPVVVDTLTVTTEYVEGYEPLGRVILDLDAGRFNLLRTTAGRVVAPTRWDYAPYVRIDRYRVGKVEVLRYDFGADALWTLGVTGCLELVKRVRPLRVVADDPETGEEIVRPAKVRVSRLDLARDHVVDGWSFDPYALEPWARGSPNTAVYASRSAKGRASGTLYVGSVKSEMLLRYYMKTALETGLYEPTWVENGWSPGTVVARAEYQLRGKRLSFYGPKGVPGGVRENPHLLKSAEVLESIWADVTQRLYIAGTGGAAHRQWRRLAGREERVRITPAPQTPERVYANALDKIAAALGRLDAVTDGGAWRALEAYLKEKGAADEFRRRRERARRSLSGIGLLANYRREEARRVEDRLLELGRETEARHSFEQGERARRRAEALARGRLARDGGEETR